MTFDDIIDVLYDISEDPVEDRLDTVMWLLGELRETYALPIEMTKNQYRFITSEYEKESVVYAVANLTSGDSIKETFHSNFWAPLSEKQVVQAWLHPETIKVID